MVVEPISVDMVYDHSLRTVTKEGLSDKAMNRFHSPYPNCKIVASSTMEGNRFQKPWLFTLERNHFPSFTYRISRIAFDWSESYCNAHIVILGRQKENKPLGGYPRGYRQVHWCCRGDGANTNTQNTIVNNLRP